MVGTEFMVAPVLDQGKSQVTVYLPAGVWVHLWSGKKYGDLSRGTYVTVDAPMGKPGVSTAWGRHRVGNLSKTCA